MLELRVLALHQPNYCALSIDSPKLSTLVFHGKAFDLTHPESIRTLDTDLIRSELAPFKKVKCLVTRRFEAISKDTLHSLPELKELNYSMTIEDAFRDEFGNAAGTMDRMKQVLNEFLDEVEALRGSDFQFRFAGFQLTKAKMDELDFSVQVFGDLEYVSDAYIYENN